MSLSVVEKFLEEEISIINLDRRKLEKSIREANLKIDEANYFIKDLESDSISNVLFSPSYNEKMKNDNLKHERDSIEKYKSDICLYEKSIQELNSKENQISSILNELQKYTGFDKVVVSHETIMKIKEVDEIVRNEIESQLNRFEEKIKSYSTVDPKRIPIEYKSFRTKMKKLENMLEENCRLICELIEE